MIETDMSLPDKLKKAIVERLSQELTAVRIRQVGSGYRFIIDVHPGTCEFAIELQTKVAKVQVK